ncbi:helix-turn-helix transcriptional regulator [Castellaniella sp.]|uniref:helix-turn-helix transcriptional regulator n=1 Tax=Castellaniella sp. TaxID=1955812 RepID=UPI002AFE653E|nr:AlpA family phage regulatory protein [Castellaniella sp.]
MRASSLIKGGATFFQNLKRGFLMLNAMREVDFGPRDTDGVSPDFSMGNAPRLEGAFVTEQCLPDRIMRLRELKDRTGMSRSTLYSLMNPKSDRYDPTFPRRVQLGARMVGWLEQEVVIWIAQKALIRAA